MKVEKNIAEETSSPEPDKEKATGVYRKLLANPPFVLLWLAQLLSQTGFNAANYGIIIIVTQVTGGSSLLVGLAIVSFTLPAVPFSILAGVYIDHLDKRFVLWVCNALRALATMLLVFALLWNRHAILALYILNFFISVITQFFTPAEEATIPLVVEKDELEAALALFNITLTLAQAVGFLILGQVITALVPPFTLVLGTMRVSVQSVDMTFAIIAVSYALCVVLILAIPAQVTRGQKKAGGDKKHALGKQIGQVIRADVKESWQIIRKDHNLLLALLRVSFVSVLLLMIGQLAGPFVQIVLGLPISDISFIFAPAGVSLVLGGILIPRLAAWLGNVRLIAIGSIGTALGFILLGLTSFVVLHLRLLMTPKILMVGAIAFLIGFALNMINIPAQTMMQEHTPEEARGRVFSFRNMFYNAISIPVLLFAGVIAAAANIQMVLYIVAAALLVFQWWARRYSQSSQV